MIFIADHIFDGDHHTVEFFERLPILPFFIQAFSRLKRFRRVNAGKCIQVPVFFYLPEVVLNSINTGGFVAEQVGMISGYIGK